ncbi:MAG: hypothetical protein P8X81_09965 [Woeseiaceae bacterium]|jgi:hypothetical protein
MSTTTNSKIAVPCIAAVLLSACAAAPNAPVERAPWYDEPAVANRQIDVSTSPGPTPERRSRLTMCETGRILHGLYMIGQNPILADAYVADWLQKQSASRGVK